MSYIYTPLLFNGPDRGSIGPGPRIAEQELTGPLVDAFVGDLATNDQLYSRTDLFVPRKCVDGRPRADGTPSFGPDAAGGTVSLVIGDALTSGRFMDPSDTASTHTTRVLEFWLGQQQPVGGHDADAAHGGSGCGACDKLKPVLRYIGTHGDDVRSFLATLGVETDDTTYKSITGRAKKLAENNYVDAGTVIIDALEATGGGGAVETLTGDHKEVALVVNTRDATTLNRAAIRAVHGDALQAFAVDVWAIKKSSQVMYADAAEADAFYYAALSYNVAVTAVLSDASLRIVVR